MTSKVSGNSSSKKIGFNWSSFSVIFKWTIIAVFILGFSKIIYTLFVSAGRIMDSLADLFGDGVKVIDGLTNGCSKQTSCSKVNPSNAPSCKAFDDCRWVDDDGDDDGDDDDDDDDDNVVSGCYTKNPDNKEGSGGPFTTQCGLFIGAIIYFCAQFVFILVGFLIKYALTKNSDQKKALDEISKRTGKDLDTQILDIKENMERNDNVEEKLKEEYENAEEGAKEKAYESLKEFYEKRYGTEFIEKMEKPVEGGEPTRDWIDGVGDVGDAFKAINDGKSGKKLDINAEIINKHHEAKAGATAAQTASVQKSHEAAMTQLERDIAKADLSPDSKRIADEGRDAIDERGREAIENFDPIHPV